jgi:hypothetical protein
MDDPQYKIVREQLGANGISLTCIYFRYGGNIYIFSYPKDGVTRHTFIDTGDRRHRDSILSILTENKIDPKAIETMIITHSHPDHYGLAHILAKQSGAKILVHSNFKGAIEGDRNVLERNLLGLRTPKELKECKIEFLSPNNGGCTIKIYGLDFIRLLEPISFGDAAKLDVLAIPQSADTHTRDQIVAIYSIRDFAKPDGELPQGYRPDNDFLFSGDLWLMRGPLFDRKMKGFSFYIRRGLFRIRWLLAGRGWHSVTVIEQDVAVKEALKAHFSVIRVKPGHGQEFLGSRILPLGLPADTDLLKTLGYSDIAEAQKIDGQLKTKLDGLLEQAYTGFIQEVLCWQKQGYALEEISEFLVRIYREQIGGNKAVALDRKQRRERMKATLSRIQNDTAVPQTLHQLAAITMSKLEKIS